MFPFDQTLCSQPFFGPSLCSQKFWEHIASLCSLFRLFFVAGNTSCIIVFPSVALLPLCDICRTAAFSFCPPVLPRHTSRTPMCSLGTHGDPMCSLGNTWGALCSLGNTWGALFVQGRHALRNKNLCEAPYNCLFAETHMCLALLCPPSFFRGAHPAQRRVPMGSNDPCCLTCT